MTQTPTYVTEVRGLRDTPVVLLSGVGLNIVRNDDANNFYIDFFSGDGSTTVADRKYRITIPKSGGGGTSYDDTSLRALINTKAERVEYDEGTRVLSLFATASGGTAISTVTLPAGVQGEKGDQGDRGEQGEKGDTGDTGPRGPTGPEGEQEQEEV